MLATDPAGEAPCAVAAPDPAMAHVRAVGALAYAAGHLADEADRLLVTLASTEAETELEAACRRWLVDAVTMTRRALEDERRAFDALTGRGA